MAIVTTKSTAPLAVVSVTFSPGDYLAKMLDSLAHATAHGTRVVLADNGSTDGVPEAEARAREGVEFLPTGGNIGYGGGMNAGVRHLNSLREAGEINQDYVLLCNPDVTFSPGSIDELIRCAEQWPQAGSVGPRIVEPDGTNYPSARAVPDLANGLGHALFGAIWPSNPWTKHYQHNSDMDVQRTAGWLSGSCVLVRWDAFNSIGGFDERYFMYLEDVDLGDRLARAGWENVYCPDAVITHAKGHSTQAHSAAMARAHHDSAYRFLADRHSQPWQYPIRVALKVGLWARASLVVAREKLMRTD